MGVGARAGKGWIEQVADVAAHRMAHPNSPHVSQATLEEPRRGQDRECSRAVVSRQLPESGAAVRGGDSAGTGSPGGVGVPELVLVYI